MAKTTQPTAEEQALTKYEKSRMQMLISALNENVTTLAAKMRVECDAIIINQCNENAYSEYHYDHHLMKCFHSSERGVGLSRNMALENCDAELCMFADEDIVYDVGYYNAVLRAFNELPLADLILFNIKQSEGRVTYQNHGYGRVRWYNYGRYPATSIAARTKKLKEAGIKFSLLFGGGARYSNGEDSLFLHDCLQKGLRIYYTPVRIGVEMPRPSTWFEGYTDKFFRDRGVLYHYLYGSMAKPLALRFLINNHSSVCSERKLGECYALMKDGIKSAEE